MDWIEKIFGMSPDNGDGSAEAMIVAISCIIASAVIVAAVPKLRDHAWRHVGNLVARFRQ
jgi:hypothetical protein